MCFIEVQNANNDHEQKRILGTVLIAYELESHSHGSFRDKCKNEVKAAIFTITLTF